MNQSKTYYAGDVIQLYPLVTCCVCGQPLDTKTFYASYNDSQKAHMSCWVKAAEVNHDTRLINYTESKPVHN